MGFENLLEKLEKKRDTLTENHFDSPKKNPKHSAHILVRIQYREGKQKKKILEITKESNIFEISNKEFPIHLFCG